MPILICIACTERPLVVESAGSSLNLASSDFSGERHYALKGQWAFYPHRFVTDFQEEGPEIQGVAQYWNDRWPDGRGYGTYLLRLTLNSDLDYGLYVPDQGTAFALFCNGRKLLESGKISDRAENWEPELKVQITDLCKGPDVILAVQVANFGHRFGGLWYPILLGTKKSIENFRNARWSTDLLLVGANSLVGLYHLALFLLRHRDRSLFWFSIYSLNNGFRLLTVNERTIQVLWPNISGELAHRAEYASICLGVPLGLLYFQSLFPEYVNKTLSRLFGLIAIAFSLNAIWGPYRYFLSTLEVFYVVGSISFLYILYVAVLLVKDKKGGAWLFMGSFAALVICIVNDILHNEYIIDTAHLAQYGFFGLIFGQSIFLARNFTTAYTRAEILGDRLANLLQFQRRLISGAANERTSVHLGLGHICRQLGIPVQGSITLFGPESVRQDFRVKDDYWERTSSATVSESQIPLLTDEGLFLPVISDGQRLLTYMVYPVRSAHWEAERSVILAMLESLALVIRNLRTREREKLEAIGRVAAEIVHDINNQCHLILQRVRQQNVQDKRLIEMIEQETHLLQNMALDVLDFSRDRQVLRLETIPLSQLADWIENDLKHLLSTHPDIHFNLNREGLDAILNVDVGRLRRLFLNLARNSLEALGDSGILTIQMLGELDYLYITFRDDGPGFSPSARPNLFEPFAFSEKPEGSGLGLAIVRQIVLSHQGQIFVETGPGQGTTFRIVLPVA
ncbi:MAG: sensor histidine kinase [Spirochaetales bacterium]|nr:sensor histidine kinase [Spirochaetales bacterium]